MLSHIIQHFFKNHTILLWYFSLNTWFEIFQNQIEKSIWNAVLIVADPDQFWCFLGVKTRLFFYLVAGMDNLKFVIEFPMRKYFIFACNVLRLPRKRRQSVFLFVSVFGLELVLYDLVFVLGYFFAQVLCTTAHYLFSPIIKIISGIKCIKMITSRNLSELSSQQLKCSTLKNK